MPKVNSGSEVSIRTLLKCYECNDKEIMYTIKNYYKGNEISTKYACSKHLNEARNAPWHVPENPLNPKDLERKIFQFKDDELIETIDVGITCILTERPKGFHTHSSS